MDFEAFRPDLDKTLAYPDGSKGRRRLFSGTDVQNPGDPDAKQFVDKRIKYLVNDRLSFMSFLGLGRSDQVPDAKTIWLFHERLKQTGAIERLFERLDATLRNASYLPACGQIRDATLVPPKQRNTNAEKADLREGNMPPSVMARD